MSDPLRLDAITSGDQPEVVELLRHVCDLTHMRFAAVARVTDSRWIACQVDDRIDFGLSAGDELDLRMTICDEIRRSGQPVVIDCAADSIDWAAHAVPAFYGFQSYVSLPVRDADDRFWGTLCALDPLPCQVSDPAVMAELHRCARRLSTLVT